MADLNRFKQLKDQSNIIFKSRFLRNLSKAERFEFLQFCHRRKYVKDEYIYYQGDPGTGMYFIEKGRVALIAKSENDDREYTYTIQSPESFGVLSIGYEFRRTSSTKCLTDCILLGFFKPDFETLKKRQPQIALKFMETLAMITMRQLNTAINDLKEVSETKRVMALQFDMYSGETEES